MPLVQIPGPTNIPSEVLEAIGRQIIDHRGPQFAALVTGILADLKGVFGTERPVVVFPGSGTGAWEAALVNTLSIGDRVLIAETGHFSNLWATMASNLGLQVDVIPGDWRHPVDPQAIEDRLRSDRSHRVKAVLATHNETSTGVLSDIGAIRRAIDTASHPALLLVDAVSSLGSTEYRHDEWGVDVTVTGSQKGLMLPPGLAFNAVSERALAVAKSGGQRRSYWDWQPVLESNRRGFFPYTPPTNLLFGLRASLDLLAAETLEHVFARHRRHAAATREAVRTWGLELQCLDSNAYSPSLTAVLMPDGHSEVALREEILEHSGMALGSGLGRLSDRVFRIGHLGSLDDGSLVAALTNVEAGLGLAKVPHRSGGAAAAIASLTAP
ncbi:MAG: aminotransferase class V-fold PLP-dependent enzyme [Acidimicrobiaceae bacterium]|nr:aminotransferase class V-fold PLP-dependent enzyme [Acidimicrobiaceae bacterium]